MKVAFKRLII